MSAIQEKARRMAQEAYELACQQTTMPKSSHMYEDHPEDEISTSGAIVDRMKLVLERINASSVQASQTADGLFGGANREVGGVSDAAKKSGAFGKMDEILDDMHSALDSLGYNLDRLGRAV